MPVRSLKVPTEVRNVIRRLHPELKRKLRAALSDILDDPTCGKALKEELEGYWSLRLEEVESSIGSASAPSKSLPLVLGKASMKRRLDKFAEIRRSADA